MTSCGRGVTRLWRRASIVCVVLLYPEAVVNSWHADGPEFLARRISSRQHRIYFFKITRAFDCGRRRKILGRNSLLPVPDCAAHVAFCSPRSRYLSPNYVTDDVIAKPVAAKNLKVVIAVLLTVALENAFPLALRHPKKYPMTSSTFVWRRLQLCRTVASAPDFLKQS